MHSSSFLDKLSITKRTSLLISAAAAVIIFVVLIVLINAYARMPLVINATFDSTAEATNFENTGAGTWQIADGVYRLTNPVSASSSPVGNANASIHKTPVTAQTWELNATIKALSSTPTRDFSVIFDYIDESNYSYVNFSTNKSDGLNGVFTLQNGAQTQLVALPTTIEADKAYAVEIRKDGSEIKVYRDKSYLVKAEGVSPASMRVGFGSRGGAVDFDNLTVSAEGAVTNPTPTPIPEPTPTPTPEPTPTPTPQPPTSTSPPSTPLPGGGSRINVSTSEQLTLAIENAKPGDIIALADGTYEGKKAVGKYTGSFAITTSGTADKPIYLTGSRNAIIEGGGTGGRYGLYFVNAKYWVVKGLTVTNSTKGIVLDGGNYNMFDGIKITQTGQEGIHFRSHSSDNTIQNSEVSYTGAKNSTYGEGIYIGSANSNWGTYTSGMPDRSDRNKVLSNTVRFTGAESMDIKEGTTGGLIQGNSMNGSGMTGSWADSWIDVKGNNYTISNNSGINALLDGFQIHVAISGWGVNNVFDGNNVNVGGPGYGLAIQAGATGTIWKCNNVVTNAVGDAVINGKTPFNCTQ